GIAERLQLVGIDLNHVIDIGVEVGISGLAHRAAPATQQHCRRRDRRLGGAPRRLLQEFEAIDLDVPDMADLADDLELRRLKRLARRVGIRRAPQHRRYAVDAAEEIEMKRGAAEFAVGDRLESDRFLKRDGVANIFVLESAQFGGVELAVEEAGARLAQRIGAQQAADMVGAKRRSRCGHPQLPGLVIRFSLAFGAKLVPSSHRTRRVETRAKATRQKRFPRGAGRGGPLTWRRHSKLISALPDRDGGSGSGTERVARRIAFFVPAMPSSRFVLSLKRPADS